MSVLTLNASYWGHILSDGTDTENPTPVFQGGNITKVGICRSYCKWSLADLPSGATISQVRFKLTIGSAGGAAGVWDIHAYNSTGQTDPDVDTGVTKYNRCASGNLYNNDTTTWRSTGSTWITLGGAIATDVQNAKSAVNRFSLAVHEEGDNDDSSNATGAGASIQLEITYTVPATEAPPEPQIIIIGKEKIGNFKKLLAILGMAGIAAFAALTADSGKNEISAGKIAEKYEASAEIKAKYQLNEAQLVLSEVKNPELDTYKGEPKDEIEITIGDNTPVKAQTGLLGAILGATEATTTEFVPSIELKRWNEVSFKIRPKGLENVATKDKTLSFEGEKIKYGTPEMDFEMYDYVEGFKFIWYLNEKPATNKIEFEIESLGLDFFYQPPLTQEYQSGYSEEFQKEIVVTETQVKDLEGNVLVERPEEYVDSWAIYHSTKGGLVDAWGKAYGTGKFGHIPRIKIFDADGKFTWGHLDITWTNPEKTIGIYSVEIPQDFLDKAVYPIKSNDTFGYTTVAATVSNLSDNQIRGSRPNTPSSSGTITGISHYGSSDNVDFRGVLYKNSDLSLITFATSKTDSIANQFTESLVTNASIDNATAYLIAVWFDNIGGTTWNDSRYDSDASYQFITDTTAYHASNDPPSTFTVASTLSSRRYSIYATYTPSGGETYQPFYINDPVDIKSNVIIN